jgi:cardiolipin synthase
VLGRGEGRVLLMAALALAVIGVVALVWPRLLAWPLAILLLWFGAALAARYRRTLVAPTEGPPRS